MVYKLIFPYVIIVISILRYSRFVTCILSLSPSLSVLSCPFECNKANIICQIMMHLNSSSPSCWFTSSHSAFSNFTQCKSLPCLKTWPVHRRVGYMFFLSDHTFAEIVEGMWDVWLLICLHSGLSNYTVDSSRLHAPDSLANWHVWRVINICM